MARLVRIAIVVCCALVVAQAIILYVVTGSRVFTRYPSNELKQMHQQQGSLTSLFGTDAGGPPLIANDFAFGLLPSPAFTPEALSVATIGGPALVAALLATFLGRTPPQASRSSPKEMSP